MYLTITLIIISRDIIGQEVESYNKAYNYQQRQNRSRHVTLTIKLIIISRNRIGQDV